MAFQPKSYMFHKAETSFRNELTQDPTAVSQITVITGLALEPCK